MNARNHDIDCGPGPLPASYVLPIAAIVPQGEALNDYLEHLTKIVEDVLVIDGSPPDVFEAHARSWSPHVRHLPPETRTSMGKVGGVMTGVVAARHERVIIADDDVRYRAPELSRMVDLLDEHEVVRPQNYFRPLPWHARWDTARSLLNRLGGGDWPGTLGVRRSVLLRTGGYSGEAMFENLELVRTVKAVGGREAVPLDLFIERRPPETAQFISQRVRQAYDEWARPHRLAAQLAILPTTVLLARSNPRWLLIAAAAAVAAAEVGRRKAKGQRVFPATSALWAPAWVVERSVTSWMALGARLLGGVRYRDRRLKLAATPMKVLRNRSTTKRPGPRDRKPGRF